MEYTPELVEHMLMKFGAFTYTLGVITGALIYYIVV